MAQGRGHQVAHLTADLTDPEAVARALPDGDVDAIIHLAGIAYARHGEPLDFYRVNTLGTGTLLSALAAAGHRPRRVVLSSSAAVYRTGGDAPLDERAPTDPRTHYGMSKLLMERLAQEQAERFAIVIARPFNYTGPGQAEHFLIPKLVAHHARRAARIALGDDVEREFNDVMDVAEAYLCLAEAGEAGETYNVCSGHAHALADVLAALAGMTTHQPEIVIDPTLVRPGEPRRVVGDPRKLHALYAAAGIPIPATPLAATLSRMLAVAQAPNEICGVSFSDSGTSR